MNKLLNINAINHHHHQQQQQHHNIYSQTSKIQPFTHTHTRTHARTHTHTDHRKPADDYEGEEMVDVSSCRRSRIVLHVHMQTLSRHSTWDSMNCNNTRSSANIILNSLSKLTRKAQVCIRAYQCVCVCMGGG